MNPLFEIDIKRPRKGARDSARSIYQQLASAIRDGRLSAGSRLPSTRSSAILFGVSRNTAAEVYQRLLDEGLAVARRGSGTFVTDRAPRVSRPASRRKPAPVDLLNPFWSRADVTRALGFWRDGPQLPPEGAPRGPVIDFRPALIDSRHFPFDVLRSTSSKALRALGRKPARFKSAQGNQGNYALRDAIRRHVSVTRAVACQTDDVLVTSGAQQAFDLLARVLVKPGETVVAFEDPGYPPMRVPFAAAGAKLMPVGVDDEGIRVDLIPPEARIICVCPSHQFPLGMTMTPRRRQALLELARRRGAVIVEDDYDGEFRYEGSPVAALYGLDASDVVFYVGTFSKCMLPALRLGFLIAPRWALGALVVAKNSLDWHCSTPAAARGRRVHLGGAPDPARAEDARGLPGATPGADPGARGGARWLAGPGPLLVRHAHHRAREDPGAARAGHPGAAPPSAQAALGEQVLRGARDAERTRLWPGGSRGAGDRARRGPAAPCARLSRYENRGTLNARTGSR